MRIDYFKNLFKYYECGEVEELENNVRIYDNKRELFLSKDYIDLFISLLELKGYTNKRELWDLLIAFNKNPKENSIDVVEEVKDLFIRLPDILKGTEEYF